MFRFQGVAVLLLLSTVGCSAQQGGVATGTNVGVPAPVNAAPAGVQSIELKMPAAAALAGRKGTYTITVPGTGKWVDAGFAVAPGDHVDVTAAGNLMLSDGRNSSPNGVTRGWKDLLRGYPLQSANPAALIGRIGDATAAVPFAMGAELKQDVSAAGELFLATNLAAGLTDAGLASNGSYIATIKIGKAAAGATVSSLNLVSHLSPAIFDQVPRRVSDEQGNQGDMVNFALLGTQAQLEKAFTAAGWVQVDKTTNDAVLHGLLATLSKQAYTEMPMSTLFLYGRPQDFSCARADPLMVAMVRHHLRVWNSGLMVAGQPMWVGSATHDTGLERDQRNNGWTHHIDPKIDLERDFIQQSFAAAGALAGAAYVTPVNPVQSARTATGGSFETDGRVLVLLLRGQ